MNSKKIKAFTISEMLVVLVVSSVVIGITFTVLNLVQKQVLGIRNSFSEQQENQILERLLWQDFNSYSVNYRQMDKTLEFTNNHDTLIYTFNKNYVLRQNDTIYTEVINSSLFLNGNLVNSGAIDAMTLITKKLYASNKIFVSKQKGADFYLNN